MRKCQFCAEEILDTSVVCEHCGRDLISGRTGAVVAPPFAGVPSSAAPVAPRTDRRASGAAKFFWVISILAGVGAGAIGFLTIATATGAPQEAAGAAIACLIAIVPYVVARGIDELTRR